MTEAQVAEVVDYYSQGSEIARLETGRGRLEFARTTELIERFLPPAPQAILDVGGAIGVYAAWLAGLGHDLHLIDPVPLHAERALETAAVLSRPFAVSLGEARHLPVANETADAVLLFGPLYHLPNREDRLEAWREAARTLRNGGLAFAIGVSRFAGLLDQLFRPDISTPGFVRTAYFHFPGELTGEAADAGFEPIAELGVEGPGWLLPDFDRQWEEPSRRQLILEAARTTEVEPGLAGLHSHFLVVAQKPARGAPWAR